MEVPRCSDRSVRGLVTRLDPKTLRQRGEREEGQATVEFALILLPLLLLVVGIIQFGIGLNYWLDIHRLSNQGARWAVVNSYPGCPRTGPQSPCSPITLQRYIACQPIALALKPTVDISFPSGASANKIGDPVKVELTTPFKLLPILGVGTLNLRAKATMRLEQDATRFTAGPYTPAACP